MATATTVLITGASKGIGRGLVRKYLSRPNTTVIAAVRQPSEPDATALHELPAAAGSRLIVVQIDSASDTSASAAMAQLVAGHGITALDMVIANAGVFKTAAFAPAAHVKPHDLLDHFDVNAVGPLRLFQAAYALLRATPAPKFIAISSAVASSADKDWAALPLNAYGASKVALNYLVRRIHLENEFLIAFAIHPGGVKTEQGTAAAEFFGMLEYAITVDESVDALVPKFDAATRNHTSGTFQTYSSDTPLPW